MSMETASDDLYHYKNNDNFVIMDDKNNIISDDMNIFSDYNYQYPISNDTFDTSNNTGVTISHHSYISSDTSLDNVDFSSNNHQSSDHNTIFPHNDPNVISPNYDNQQFISNDNCSNNINYKPNPQYTDPNQYQSSNFPSLNSINITIHSPQENLTEILKFGIKIIIMPLTSDK
ncbi:unnamed protein product [Rhizophagus irregularis]|uniref:Uncharacterized protein n=1 Tax=Rhizophagus irregularis TaxID=588596 RepID=A0A2I1FZR3_9GLOM|nr:hypothetical protein RhiirA4_453094 [Rhizophagus irregularis]CAB4432489.1 unnamed protein product [Rhizophagus irregularis]